MSIIWNPLRGQSKLSIQPSNQGVLGQGRAFFEKRDVFSFLRFFRREIPAPLCGASGR